MAIKNNFLDYRSQFALPESKIFLDHAFAGPLCIPARDRMIESVNLHARGGATTFVQLMNACEQSRISFAEFINVSVGEVAPVNTTSGTLSLVATGLNLKAGNNVVVPAIDYTSNLYPWLLKKGDGVEVRLVQWENGKNLDDALLRACDTRTKVMALSWVQFSNGFRHDIEKLGSFCKENDIIFVVDANHAIGSLHVDMQIQPIDILVSQVFKWLCGPYNSGWIYIKDKVLEKVNPPVVGPLSLELDHSFSNTKLKKKTNASKFLTGVPNYYGIIGTSGCLELFSSIGMKNIESQNASLARYLHDRLKSKGYEVRTPCLKERVSPIISFKHPAPGKKSLWNKLMSDISIPANRTMNAKGLDRTGVDKPHIVLCEYLLSQNICVSMREGAIRVSPHFYNSKDELDSLVRILP